MSCLADERFIEILDLGGLEAAQPPERAHLEACDACRDAWASVAAAGEVLTEARPRGARRAAIAVPLAAAAAMLIAVVAVIAMKPTPTALTRPAPDPIEQFLNGTAEEASRARPEVLKLGRKAIPGLVAARSKFRGSARFAALQDLIWDLKRAGAQDPEQVKLFQALTDRKMDMNFENTRAQDLIAFIISFYPINIVLDSTVDPPVIDKYVMKDSTLRDCLDVLCAVAGLDFDVRYGVVFPTCERR